MTGPQGFMLKVEQVLQLFSKSWLFVNCEYLDLFEGTDPLRGSTYHSYSSFAKHIHHTRSYKHLIKFRDMCEALAVDHIPGFGTCSKSTYKTGYEVREEGDEKEKKKSRLCSYRVYLAFTNEALFSSLIYILFTNNLLMSLHKELFLFLILCLFFR